MSHTIQSFYQAFADYDAEKTVFFYADDIEFTDPAFGTLKGERAKNMWRMLLASQRGKKFEVVFLMSWKMKVVVLPIGKPSIYSARLEGKFSTKSMHHLLSKMEKS